ncbi:hypothetical protein C8R45DRAFT_1109844 [Mycena sanguinolenta]|nr:hypothetical protein C8R45DRAFT_1109844 [Mycena sanguinolenta]
MCTAHYTRPHQRRERHLRVVRLLAFQHVVRKVGVLSAGLGVSMCYAVAVALAAAKKIAEPQRDERWHEEDDCVAVGDEGVAQHAKNVDDEEHYGFFALPRLPDVDVDGDEDEGAVAVPDPAGDGAGDWPRAWDLGVGASLLRVACAERIEDHIPVCLGVYPCLQPTSSSTSPAPPSSPNPILTLHTTRAAPRTETTLLTKRPCHDCGCEHPVKMPLAEAVVVVGQLRGMGHEERGVFFDGMGQA